VAQSDRCIPRARPSGSGNPGAEASGAGATRSLSGLVSRAPAFAASRVLPTLWRTESARRNFSAGAPG
jgi:hypothetical protein